MPYTNLSDMRDDSAPWSASLAQHAVNLSKHFSLVNSMDPCPASSISLNIFHAVTAAANQVIISPQLITSKSNFHRLAGPSINSRWWPRAEKTAHILNSSLIVF
jgi:hypothetical protein